MAGSYGNSRFNLLRKHQAVSHSGCTIFHSHQQCIRVPITPHPHQPLLFSILGLFWLLFFIYIAILVCVKWYLVVVLIYISLMTNGVDHLFMWLSSLKKCLFKSFAHFLIGLSLPVFVFSIKVLNLRLLRCQSSINIASSFLFFFFGHPTRQAGS